MLGTSPHTFVALPNERTLYTSPARTTFALTSTGQNPLNITSSSGVVIITNQRVSPPAAAPGFPQLTVRTGYLHPEHADTRPRVLQRTTDAPPRQPGVRAVFRAEHVVVRGEPGGLGRAPGDNVRDRDEAGV